MHGDEHEEYAGQTVDEAGAASEYANDGNAKGDVKIAEEVISQIATRALASVEGVRPATSGLMANLRSIGRKAVNGVRIAMTDGDIPEVTADAYISVKYGLRIPNVCCAVQDAIKDQIEQLSGCKVRSVNVYVQGLVLADADGEEEEVSAGTEEE